MTLLFIFVGFFLWRVPAKRVIIRQGQIADSFYFIISGQAMVTILEEDKNTNETKNRIVAILKDGTCFGVSFYLRLWIVYPWF